MEEKILEFVEYLQADSYKEGISWKGFKVYIPEYKNNPVIGLPYVILVKDEEVRLSTPEESLDYLDYSLSQDKKTKQRHENIK
ncbi:MAG: hypothetical protein IKD20_04420 [Clostridia bacterium]|nr:hypothetical protein [Clostridia bacterium]